MQCFQESLGLLKKEWKISMGPCFLKVFLIENSLNKEINLTETNEI